MHIVLNDFLKNRIDANQLKKVCGFNLHDVEVDAPVVVCSKDLIFLINQYLIGRTTLQRVVDWVNVVWFTDLFEYNPLEEDSIASVMSYLETLDEEGVLFSEKEFLKMIECLSNNVEYEKDSG